MGMDVHGQNASSEQGAYFRANVWGWHPLATYCNIVAPEIWRHIEYAHSNDGDGLNDEHSKELAVVLKQKVESGETESYVQIRQAELDALPNEVCKLCSGSGKRDWSDPQLAPEYAKGKSGKFECNSCHGAGSNRPSEAWYHLSTETVEEFAQFLQDCGGFEIW